MLKSYIILELKILKTGGVQLPHFKHTETEAWKIKILVEGYKLVSSRARTRMRFPASRLVSLFI